MKRVLIAVAVALALLAPTVVRAQSNAELIAADLDAWWAANFAERGLSYSSPRLEIVDQPGTNFCGFIDVFEGPAGYCATNRTVYLSTGFLSPDSITGVLPLISHEWGHHVQNLVDTGVSTPMEAELQADCFAGAFIQYATESDWISPAVGAMALQLTQSAGDVWWLVPADEAIHGSQSDRAIAFMTGLHGGLSVCGF
ncbi:MAG: neutral zinc metallopeptidase [Thermomicrobiales bacterium]|nr:neutral zinc metallopeptidase [Thermomicrobiales bacterium]